MERLALLPGNRPSGPEVVNLISDEEEGLGDDNVSLDEPFFDAEEGSGPNLPMNGHRYLDEWREEEQLLLEGMEEEERPLKLREEENRRIHDRPPVRQHNRQVMDQFDNPNDRGNFRALGDMIIDSLPENYLNDEVLQNNSPRAYGIDNSHGDAVEDQTWWQLINDRQDSSDFAAGNFNFDDAFQTPNMQSQDHFQEGGGALPQGFSDIPANLAQNLTPTGLPDPAIAREALKTKIMELVSEVFPGICKDYVSELFESNIGFSDDINAHILEQMDAGKAYPKEKDIMNERKRKRDSDVEESAVAKYGALDRPEALGLYRQYTRQALQVEPGLSQIPMSFIDSVLRQSNYNLFPAYLVLEEAQRTWNVQNPAYNPIKTARKATKIFQPEETRSALNNPATHPDMNTVLRELEAARQVRRNANDQREAARLAQLAEDENTKRAQADGSMGECGCCFDDIPMNRMVHCNSEGEIHWFCRLCAKTMAETEIGNGKYELTCMSMEGCTAGFSRKQRADFLEEGSIVTLERNEAEAMLRLAGIENLASCPFCPWAAEYPPVEENKELRCQNPGCEKVSCRLCNLETHIPKSCEEHAKESGLSIRRTIEEAMSAALIRRCNKCSTPFIKEEGCNKMTCSKCGNIQCYVCSQSCDYNHFDDSSRGGKHGNCPLFEDVRARHAMEISEAEKRALAAVRAEHPEYTDDDLRIKVSDAVKKDEERMLTMGLPGHPGRMFPPPLYGMRVPDQRVGGLRPVAVPGAPDYRDGRGAAMLIARAEYVQAQQRQAILQAGVQYQAPVYAAQLRPEEPARLVAPPSPPAQHGAALRPRAPRRVRGPGQHREPGQLRENAHAAGNHFEINVLDPLNPLNQEFADRYGLPNLYDN